MDIELLLISYPKDISMSCWLGCSCTRRLSFPFLAVEWSIRVLASDSYPSSSSSSLSRCWIMLPPLLVGRVMITLEGDDFMVDWLADNSA